MAAPTSDSLRSLATSIREHGGDPGLAIKLDEEAAKMLLGSCAFSFALMATAVSPSIETYDSVVKAWHASGLPSRLLISDIWRLSTEAGIDPAGRPTEADEKTHHTRLRRLFGRWLRSFPIRHTMRGGCIWYERPALPSAPAVP